MQTYSGLGPWEGAGSENFARLVEKTMEAECAAANKVVDRAVNLLKHRFVHAHVEGESLQGFAKDSILTNAADWSADLLIVGSHGRRGFTGFVLGSVSKAVAVHAPCSVMVVRAENADESKDSQEKALKTVGASS